MLLVHNPQKQSYRLHLLFFLRLWSLAHQFSTFLSRLSILITPIISTLQLARFSPSNSQRCSVLMVEVEGIAPSSSPYSVRFSEHSIYILLWNKSQGLCCVTQQWLQHFHIIEVEFWCLPRTQYTCLICSSVKLDNRPCSCLCVVECDHR